MKLVVLTLALSLFEAFRGEQSPTITPIDGGLSGDGVTTRYWDCCAPSCAWDQIVHTQNGKPVQTCQKDGVTYSSAADNARSGCYDGGVAYACSNQTGFVVNSTLAYGLAAASFTGGIDYDMCCTCFLLTFKGQLMATGKQMVVQVTNTGSDLNMNQFDIAIPGGGVGIFTKGCSSQWGTPDWGWGDPNNGVTTEEQCNELPSGLQSGCKFRFGFMEGASNPDVSFVQIRCPAELVALTGCGDL